MSDQTHGIPAGDMPLDTSGHDWPDPLEDPDEEQGESLANDGTPGAVDPKEA